MQDLGMMAQNLINLWWPIITGLNATELKNNASSLSHLHGCDKTLGLIPLPNLQFPDIPTSDILSQKPAFKHLDIPDILFMRKCLFAKEISPVLSIWAETLLRYLEINLATILKKARSQFCSARSGQMALLELTAFMLDLYFEWDDLRYLNIALKLMDKPGILSINSISRNYSDQNRKLPQILIQVRLLILRQAALQEICKS
jgi:hypothetical protein